MRAHHGLVEARPRDDAFRRYLHVAHVAQAIDVRVQRAEPVRQCLGQHRHHAIRKVHRRAAPARLAIERRVCGHVVADVGDRDDQPPAVALALAEHGVVEVARVGAVDRHERHVPQVLAAFLGFGRHFGGPAARLVQRFLRPVARNAVREDRDLGLDTGIVGAADDFDHAADRMAVLRRVLEHFDGHDVSGLCAVRLAARDQHFDARIGAVAHEIDAALAAKLARELRLATRQDLDDVPLAATRCFAGANRYAIAFPQELHLARGEVQIIAAVVRLQEAEAVAMRDHDAGDHVEMAREAELVGAIAKQLAVANHRPQPGFQRAAMLFGLDAESRCERFEQQRLARLLHRLQDFVAARDLVFVLAFAAFVGVAGRTRH